MIKTIVLHRDCKSPPVVYTAERFVCVSGGDEKEPHDPRAGREILATRAISPRARAGRAGAAAAAARAAREKSYFKRRTLSGHTRTNRQRDDRDRTQRHTTRPHTPKTRYTTCCSSSTDTTRCDHDACVCRLSMPLCAYFAPRLTTPIRMCTPLPGRHVTSKAMGSMHGEVRSRVPTPCP